MACYDLNPALHSILVKVVEYLRVLNGTTLDERSFYPSYMCIGSSVSVEDPRLLNAG